MWPFTWPARNEPENGPLRRATVREMHKPVDVTTVLADTKSLAGESNPQAVGYGYGLHWAMDAKRVVRVGHSGGLPGFGSNHTFFPDHGIAVICFANVTYAAAGAANHQAAALVLEKAGLPARPLPASRILEQRKQEIARLVQSWDATLATAIVGEISFPTAVAKLGARAPAKRSRRPGASPQSASSPRQTSCAGRSLSSASAVAWMFTLR